MQVAASVLAGIGAAGLFAIAALLQQLAAREAPEEESLHLSLLLRLVHRPLWLAGLGVMLLGYALEATALAFGPVALVQPLIVTELVFALPLAMWVGRLRAGLREWVATIAIVSGVALFVTTTSPTPGTADPGPALWLSILVPAALIMLGVTAVQEDIHRRVVLDYSPSTQGLPSACWLCSQRQRSISRLKAHPSCSPTSSHTHSSSRVSLHFSSRRAPTRLRR